MQAKGHLPDAFMSLMSRMLFGPFRDITDLETALSKLDMAESTDPSCPDGTLNSDR